MNSPDNKLTGAALNTSPDGKAHAGHEIEGPNLVHPSIKDSARKYLIASEEGKVESPKKKEDKK